MDVFSLEDEGNDLFLTQKDPEHKFDVKNVGILGDGSDFVSPCVSLVSVKQDQYSDISDDDFEFPSSQNYKFNK